MSKLFKKKQDGVFEVTYLGNVLTKHAKNIASFEHSLDLLLNNYKLNKVIALLQLISHLLIATNQVAVKMALTVTSYGLKAVTDKYGLTDYFATRITACFASAKVKGHVFCWVYRRRRHDLSEELRVHAAICSKGDQLQTLPPILINVNRFL